VADFLRQRAKDDKRGFVLSVGGLPLWRARLRMVARHFSSYHAVEYFTPLLMPGLILKARGHDIRKGHLGWTFWSPPGLPGGGITGVFPALGVGTLMAGSMSGGQMTPAVWSSFSLSVSLVRSC